MSQRHNLHIVAFVGLEGSGKTTAVEYLGSKGYPRVENNDMISQIEHLAQAGQHRIVTDELTDLELYQALKHAFPGQLTVVGITANTKVRHARLAHDLVAPVNEHEARAEDWEDAQTDAGPFALADYFIENDGDKESFFKCIDALLDELGLVG